MAKGKSKQGDNQPAVEELNSEAETEENQPEEKTEEPAAEEQPAKEEASIEEELAETKDKYLRLYSEFENFRRRTAREKLELVTTANEGLMHALLPILDDFERADKSYSEGMALKSMKEGVDLIYAKFKNVLEQKGIIKIEVEQGSEFDIELHEAITQIPAPKESLKSKVVEVIENGYQLNGKVIRFAKVVTGA